MGHHVRLLRERAVAGCGSNPPRLTTIAPTPGLDRMTVSLRGFSLARPSVHYFLAILQVPIWHPDCGVRTPSRSWRLALHGARRPSWRRIPFIFQVLMQAGRLRVVHPWRGVPLAARKLSRMRSCLRPARDFPAGTGRPCPIDHRPAHPRVHAFSQSFGNAQWHAGRQPVQPRVLLRRSVGAVSG